ncbi:hypothetical protein I79_021306 [Cricetulus griseus]|uniref:Uncharacterized protein n=1 Tax=Cricetulus griseus TaxID=10029 RepID=G3ICB3_CRIGR|nr:hypothetical protein I79_021306 [Cricetulus griseus]
MFASENYLDEPRKQFKRTTINCIEFKEDKQLNEIKENKHRRDGNDKDILGLENRIQLGDRNIEKDSAE